MEENGLQIFIYVIAFAVWIASTFFKAKNKQKRQANRTPATPSPPVQQYESTPEVVVETSFDEIDRGGLSDAEILIKSLTVRDVRRKDRNPKNLEANSYKDNLKYRNKATKKTAKKIIATETDDVESDISEIDWKKAVIYSEILRPRF